MTTKNVVRINAKYFILAVVAVGFGLYLSYLFNGSGESDQARKLSTSSKPYSPTEIAKPKVPTKPKSEKAVEQAQTSKAISMPIQKEIQAESLRLTLEGVFLSSRPEKATAMIKNSEGLSKLYFAGEALAPTVKLLEINRDYVVVLKNETPIRLELNRNRDSSVVTTGSAPLPTAYNGTPSAHASQRSGDRTNYSTPTRIDKQEVMQRLNVLRQETYTRPQ